MKKFLLGLAAAACTTLVAAPAAAQVTFTFTASDTVLDVGETATISFSISGLDAEVLSAFDLNFTWSQAVTGSSAWSFAPVQAQLGAGATVVEDSPVPGNFGVQGFSLLSDAELSASQDNSFLFGTFTITGTAEGTSTFSLGLDPDFERNFVGLDFASLDVAINPVTVTVTAVPEPGTYALMFVGLACVGAAARRRRTAKAS